MGDSKLKGRQLRVECKKSAKELLKGNWGVFVGSTVLLFLMALVVDFTLMFVPLVGSILSGIIVTLLSIGQLSMSLILVDGSKPSIGNLFDGFKKNPMKSACMFLLLTAMLTPVMVIAMLPLIGVFGVALFDGSVAVLSSALLLVFVAVVFVCIVTVVLSAYFFAVFYMILEGDDRGIWDIFKSSKALIKGRVWEYIVFNLSFIGWSLTIPFTLGLSLLWIAPYTSVSLTNYYRYLKEDSILITDNVKTEID